jgi:hypothetical protein
MLTNSRIGLAYALLASGLLVRDSELSAPAQTNAVDPETPAPQPESRQVRRARERREAKAAQRRGYT